LSGLDKKGSKFPNGINVPNNKMFINDTAITATAAELNILDGVTASTAELNILDGVTASTAEINILDGVTATAAELNILDGVTATAAEINRGAFKKVTGPLGTASEGGGIFSWQNPESGPILVQHLVINVTKVSNAACTIDCGIVKIVTPNDSSGNLIDGLDVNAATGTFTNDESAGAYGKPFKRLAPGEWVTGSKSTGDAAGLEGTYEIYYQVL